MKVLVIDDESQARNLMRNILKSAGIENEEIFESANLLSGVDCIRKVSPDLVFLDIEMPGEAGTQILEHFGPHEITFKIVFTTAYSEFAVKAFELNAIDYLLKPIRPQRVEEIVEKVRQEAQSEDIQAKFEALRQSLHSGVFDKIGLPVKDGILFVPLDEIIHLEADGMYTKVFRRDHPLEIISKPLKFFNYILETGGTFYRPHRSHIINLKYLKQLVRSDGTHILLENDQIIPISKDKKEEFLSLVSSI